MNSTVKEKWLKALRSGEYKQGYGCLKSGDEFCCLAVLSDIYAKENNSQWKPGCFNAVVNELHDSPEDKFIYERAGTLRVFICEWAELAERDPKIKPPKEGAPDSLAKMNDAGYTFKEIADVIEEQL